MGLLLTFLVGFVCVSAALYAAARLFLALDARADQWPLLWATCLLLSAIIPAAGILLLLLPDLVAQPSFDILSLHEPLQSLGLIPTTMPALTNSAQSLNLANAGKVIAILYLAGVVLNIAKLMLGRYRIRRLILAAEPLGEWSGEDVLISPVIQSPFAWTPFGQHRHSRIVIPQTYPDLMSRESLNDILIHEREHIARRDDECGQILRTILCVCWISPFAHRLFGYWSQSTEIRCDMAVTDGRTPRMRKAYADTLLQALHIMAGRVQQYPAASFSTHRIRNEKMRITHIMTGTRPTYKRRRDKLGLGLIASAITIIGTISVSATASAGSPKSESAKSSLNSVSSEMVSGRISAKFGASPDPFKAGEFRDHYGVDIAAPLGTPIYAPADGIITSATDLYDGKPAYGNVVVLESADGVLTLFSHLDGYTVRPGQSVTQGTQIATVGSSGKSTGPHVHIETYKNGARVDPLGVWPLQAR